MIQKKSIITRARRATAFSVVAFFVTAFSMVAFSAMAAEQITPDQIVTYKKVGGVELKLHVFKPGGHQASDKRSAIVFFFGGGWSGGTPKQFYEQSRFLANHGLVAFAAEYRVSGVHKTSPYECVKDGKSAIRWVREYAAQWGVDPERIVSSGGSAGGHVAACTGVIQGFEEEGENGEISSVPNAMVLFNPVIDTTAKGYGAQRFQKGKETELSPCHHVSKGIVPTIVFHGTADQTTPFENVERFARLMKEAGNGCVLVPFEGRRHGFFNGSFFRPRSNGVDYSESMQKTLRFLREQGMLE
jgi:acetyl esterase